MIFEHINQDFEAIQEIKNGYFQRTEISWEDVSSNESVIKEAMV